MTEVVEVEEFVKEGAAVVEFYRANCAACRALEPVLAKLAAEYPEVKIGKANMDLNPAMAVRYRIRGAPTTLYFRDGKVVGMNAGAVARRVLVEQIEGLLR